MTVSAVLTVLAVLEHLDLLLIAYKTQCQETTMTVLTVLTVLAISIVTATPPPPLNSTPLFRHPDLISVLATLVARAIRNAIRANRFARIIRN